MFDNLADQTGQAHCHSALSTLSRLCGYRSVVAPGQSGLGNGPRDDTEPSWWHGERSESGGVSDGSVLCTTAFDMVRDERAGKLQRGDVEVNCGSRENRRQLRIFKPAAETRVTPLYSFCTRVPHSGHGGDHLMIFEGRNSQLYRKRWVVPSPFRKDQSWPNPNTLRLIGQDLCTDVPLVLQKRRSRVIALLRFATILPLNRFLFPLQIFPSACQTVPYSNSRVGHKGFPVSSHLAGQIATVLIQHFYRTPCSTLNRH